MQPKWAFPAPASRAAGAAGEEEESIRKCLGLFFLFPGRGAAGRLNAVTHVWPLKAIAAAAALLLLLLPAQVGDGGGCFFVPFPLLLRTDVGDIHGNYLSERIRNEPGGAFTQVSLQ